MIWKDCVCSKIFGYLSCFKGMNHTHWSHYFLIIFHACWILKLVVKRFSEKTPKLWSFPRINWSLASKDSESNAQVIRCAFMNSCCVKMQFNYNYAPLKNNCFKVCGLTLSWVNNAIVFISIFLFNTIFLGWAISWSFLIQFSTFSWWPAQLKLIQI